MANNVHMAVSPKAHLSSQLIIQRRSPGRRASRAIKAHHTGSVLLLYIPAPRGTTLEVPRVKRNPRAYKRPCAVKH